jgi:hypothetical protein
MKTVTATTATLTLERVMAAKRRMGRRKKGRNPSLSPR